MARGVGWGHCCETQGGGKRKHVCALSRVQTHTYTVSHHPFTASASTHSSQPVATAIPG
jgi:hypothetical protein